MKNFKKNLIWIVSSTFFIKLFVVFVYTLLAWAIVVFTS